MDPILEEFQAKWVLGKGPSRDEAKRIAIGYTEAHKAALAPVLEPLSLEDIVHLIDAYREVGGREEDIAIAECWLLSEYEPQNISGAIQLGGLAEAAIEAINRGEVI